MLTYETPIRLGTFLLVLLLMFLFEVAYPRRQRVASKTVRWLNNLGLTVVNSLMLQLLFPVLAVGTALLAAQNGWGLANRIPVSPLLSLPLGILLLDLLIYWQHRLFHHVALLWRFHRMHHIDPDLDVTSGTRFHTVEIILSMLIKIGAVLLLGLPALAVLVFEVVLNASAMFNHGNVFIPLTVDRALRQVIVTPDMHRVHHSVYPRETNANYGFFLSIWDRWFKTYRDQPEDGHESMRIGIGQFLDRKFLTLHWLLVIPFLDPED